LDGQSYGHVITVAGHLSEWNGDYCRTEDWAHGYHFQKDEDHHFYYFPAYSLECVQFDSRDQDGTNDYYDGGYYCDYYSLADYTDLTWDPDYEWGFWLGDDDYAVTLRLHEVEANGGASGGEEEESEEESEYNEWSDDAQCTPTHESGHVINVEDHPADGWSGAYCRMEDWNGFPHFAKDQDHHWYYFEAPGVYYCW